MDIRSFFVDIPCFHAQIYNTDAHIGELKILYYDLEKSLKDIQDFSIDFWTMEDNLTMKANPTPSDIIEFDIIVQNNTAVYQKYINTQGETIKYLKQVFGPDGQLISTKGK